MIPKSTPLFIYGSRHGTLYNLTPTNMPKNIPAVQLSYGDFHDHIETIANLPQGMPFKKFINYPNTTLTYLTPYDFSKPDCMTGSQHNDKVKIKTNKGYHQVTADQYDKLIQAIKPDYFVGLTEYPSLQKDHSAESNKSHKRAILKTKTYLQKSKYTRSQQYDNQAQNCPVRLAAVHGGKNLSLIARSLEQILDHAVDGIVVCNMYEGETLQERQEVFNAINKRLEQEYERENSYFKNKKLKMALAGYGKLEDIMHAMKFGFQIFQVNYPFLMAEKHLALIKNNETGIYQAKPPVKKQELKPLQATCKCYTCVNHSEAYIAHLIDCFEMTAKVLLSIHNTHVYESWLQNYKTV